MDLKFLYLCIVLKIGFENVFNVGRVNRENLPWPWCENSEGLVPVSKLCKVMVQPTEVQELMDGGAHNRMILFLPT